MLIFDKQEIRDFLSEDNMMDLLQEFGGDPERTKFGIICTTICHNPPGDGSRKLYWYSNTGLFRCYTGCDEPIFDIFELVIKVMNIQHHINMDLNEAVRWVASKFGFVGRNEETGPEERLNDWTFLANYDRIQDIKEKSNHVILKEYDINILNNLDYNIKITPWLNEGITQEVLNQAQIGFYLGGDQITIPHFDKDGRFIGLRGRSICAEEAEHYGKYRPLCINKIQYNHPLGMNLYNLNNSQDNIKIIKKAIVFEGEKSALLYKSYFGIDNDISVACCGSNISAYQVQLLKEAGANEIIIAFDRQFQEIGDNEFKRLKSNLIKIHNKYCKEINVSLIFDKNKLTNYKDSPIDCGPDIFLKLFKERIVL